jgi:hypothetical protein
MLKSNGKTTLTAADRLRAALVRIAELEALLRQKEEDCDELKVALDHERLPASEREYCAKCSNPRPLDCPHCGDRYPFV